MTDYISARDLATACNKIEEQIWLQCTDITGYCEPIIDGIVNVDKYHSSRLRILWILKEAYDDVKDGNPSGGGWHYADDFLNLPNFQSRIGRSWSTWHPIIYTTYGLLNNFLCYDDMDWIKDEPVMADVVAQIAVINVKKLPGFTRTRDFSTIVANYHQHKLLLHKQIETYNPDIIIGGGTLKLFLDDLGLSDCHKNVYRSVHYYCRNNTVYFDAYHPAQTSVSRQEYVDSIIEVARSIYTNIPMRLNK